MNLRSFTIPFLLTALMFSSCHYFVRNYQISSTAMAETLMPGQIVVAVKMLAYERNSIAVFTYTYKNQDEKTETIPCVFRIIAKSGDSLEIKEGDVYVNGQKTKLPTKAKTGYIIQTTEPLNKGEFKNYEIHFDLSSDNAYQAQLTLEQVNELRKMRVVDTVIKILYEPEYQEPGIVHLDSSKVWTVDFFGPLFIPEIGDTVELNENNNKLYRQVTNQKSGKLAITENLYFFMGDSRHNSQDSRYIGLIPESDLLGVVKESKKEGAGN